MDKKVIKSKIDNFWYYYKKPTIFIVIGVIMVSILAINYSNRKVYDINISILDPDINSKTNFDMQNRISEGVYGETGKVNLDVIPIESSKSKASKDIDYIQKFVVRLTGGEVDVIIADKDTINSIIDMKNILDLSDIVDKKYLDDGIVKDDRLYAVNTKDLGIFKDYDINTGDKYICIPDNAENMQSSKEVLRWITDNGGAK